MIGNFLKSLIKPFSTSTSTSNTASVTRSRRPGALGFKKGMMSYWDSWGVRHPVTILHLDHVQALDTFKSGSTTIQNIGIGHKSAKNVHSAQLKLYERCAVAPKLKIRGFPVDEQAALEPGQFIFSNHFVPGQLVDVQGTSIGKGFQGAMKRWGFHGMPASHGVSLAHRAIGATGGRSDPGRVFKGKKMAGRMGGDAVTVRKLKVMKVDSALNCIWVRGAVPGCDGGVIRIVDSNCPENRKLFSSTTRPYPTFMPDFTQKLAREFEAPTDTTIDPLYKKLE